MEKQKRHIFKKIVALFVCTFLIGIFACLMWFILSTSSAHLDRQKFVSSKNKMAFTICDANGNQIDDQMVLTDDYVKIEELPDHVKNAFIAVEDKRFYSHHGIDLKRMGGAVLKNLKNRKASEGASTITQQLIKNTHLSREKTLQRKMKEIKLALEAERIMSKDEILEEYLNTIYFGNGAYGIENASKTYFAKSAKELSINESAVLASVINAPRVYDPYASTSACEKRKNLVLSLMKSQEMISEDDYQKNAKSGIQTVQNGNKTSNLALKSVIGEVCDLLKVSENQLRNMKVSIYCDIDFSLQKSIQNILESGKYSVLGEKGFGASVGVIVVDNASKSVVSFAGVSTNNLSEKHQPGSLIKPLLVYAPAIESGQIYPESIVKDEPINIGGYAPTNANKTFLGDVSIKVAIEKSLNIPAVKTMSNLGVQKAKNFAEGLGITFDGKDQNLALALGGMTKGVSIKQLADAYSAFATNGNYCESTIVSKIVDSNGKILYENQKKLSKAMKDSTAYLMTDMLKGVVQNGTARRLKGFDFDVAAKTGTVGISSSSKNSDAYIACYTTSHTIVCFIRSNAKSGALPSSVNGSTYPASLAREILEILYSKNKPNDFAQPQSVILEDIDVRCLKDSKVLLASSSTPERYKKQALFDKNNLPEISQGIDAHTTLLHVYMEENKKPTLEFESKNGFEYQIVRKNRNSEKIIYLQNGNGEKLSYIDINAQSGEIYEYYVQSVAREHIEAKARSNSVKLFVS